MELGTGALSWWKYHWRDLKNVGLFRRNLIWTPLKPQYSNLNPNPLANQLWRYNFLAPPTPIIIPHSLSAFLESLMPLKIWCSIHASLKHSIRLSVIFPSLKHNLFAYRSSEVSLRPNCIFEIRQLWQSGFSRVYSTCSGSCSFESETIKIGQSSHKIYSNNLLNLQESTTIKCLYQKSLETYWRHYACQTPIGVCVCVIL